MVVEGEGEERKGGEPVGAHKKTMYSEGKRQSYRGFYNRFFQCFLIGLFFIEGGIRNRKKKKKQRKR